MTMAITMPMPSGYSTEGSHSFVRLFYFNFECIFQPIKFKLHTHLSDVSVDFPWIHPSMCLPLRHSDGELRRRFCSSTEFLLVFVLARSCHGAFPRACCVFEHRPARANGYDIKMDFCRIPLHRPITLSSHIHLVSIQSWKIQQLLVAIIHISERRHKKSEKKEKKENFCWKSFSSQSFPSIKNFQPIMFKLYRFITIPSNQTKWDRNCGREIHPKLTILLQWKNSL